MTLGMSSGLYAWYAIYNSGYTTGAGRSLDQPVLFSHRHHVTELGIDCRYCHASVDESPFAGMPSTETCMTCHSQVFTDSPMLAPVRESYATGVPIRWNRVYDLPDHVHFRHDIHIARSIDCRECHGAVENMALLELAQPLFMDWCVTCHRQNEPTSPPGEDLKQNTLYASGEGPLLQKQQINPLTNCSVCHY